MKESTVRILSLAVAVPVFAAGIGYCLNTSFDPDVFGKYEWSYFAFLCVWFLLVVPGAYLFGRFLFGTQAIRLSRGRTVLVRPRAKIPWLVAIAVSLFFAGTTVLQWRVTRTTATVHTDVFHPFLQNVPRPGRHRYTINSWGFRGEEIAREKAPETFRIFVLGGSTVFCGDIEFEGTHCRILERLLRERYPERTIEVQNAGVDWHASTHSVFKLLNTVQDFDPDLIIVFHAVNDLLRSLTPDAFAEPPYRNDYGHYYGAVANYVHPQSSARFLINMYFGHWASDLRFDRIRVLGPDGKGVRGATTLFAPKARPVEITEWPSLYAFERNMRDLFAIARRKGYALITATQPYLYARDLGPREREVIWFPKTHCEKGTRPSVASMTSGMEQFNAVTARVAAETGTPFLDLEAMVPKDLEHFYDDVHYTHLGNEVVARAFFDFIVQEGLVTERP